LKTTPLTGQAAELIGLIPYFENLSAEQLSLVNSQKLTRNLNAGQIAFLEDDTAAGLYMLVSGRAKISRLSRDGREQVLSILKPGDSCNEVPVIDGGPNPATLTAIEPTTVWIWTRSGMDLLRKEIPPLNELIMQSLAGRCRELVDRVYRLSFFSVTERLANFLLDQASLESLAGLDRQRWTQEEIAAHIGTVREMVSRSLRSLENDGLIRFNRHRIEIKDRAGLEKLV